MKNKIGWCNMTWNPVIGCKNNCEYCYARRINDWVKFIKDWNEPEWREKSFNRKLPKKPQRIFVGSMSEIYYWEHEWMNEVLYKINQFPQHKHTFQFLTKHPEIYLKYRWPSNCWLGVTITDTKNYDKIEYYKFKVSNPNNLKFISFEPLLDEIFINLEGIDWVIIGFQTNPLKKIEKKAITDIIKITRKNNIPLFLKDSIYKGYPDLPIIKEFPGGG